MDQEIWQETNRLYKLRLMQELRTHIKFMLMHCEGPYLEEDVAEVKEHEEAATLAFEEFRRWETKVDVRDLEGFKPSERAKVERVFPQPKQTDDDIERVAVVLADRTIRYVVGLEWTCETGAVRVFFSGKIDVASSEVSWGPPHGRMHAAWAEHVFVLTDGDKVYRFEEGATEAAVTSSERRDDAAVVVIASLVLPDSEKANVLTLSSTQQLRWNSEVRTVSSTMWDPAQPWTAFPDGTVVGRDTTTGGPVVCRPIAGLRWRVSRVPSDMRSLLATGTGFAVHRTEHGTILVAVVCRSHRRVLEWRFERPESASEDIRWPSRCWRTQQHSPFQRVVLCPGPRRRVLILDPRNCESESGERMRFADSEEDLGAVPFVEQPEVEYTDPACAPKEARCVTARPEPPRSHIFDRAYWVTYGAGSSRLTCTRVKWF